MTPINKNPDSDGVCSHSGARLDGHVKEPGFEEMANLLEEVVDWLCPHAEAIEVWRKGAGRAWCCDCHNYIRSEADATLQERVRKVLAATRLEQDGQGAGG